jgi:Tol biopolymer transport system component/imidazolonepropionase-like amidohydrolase
MIRSRIAIASLVVLVAATPRAEEVVVTEGTSMAVAVSPDGQTLAIDLQGSIWTLPAQGGQARRITDGYDDARQPAWSPDGKSIAYHAFRHGGYDIWVAQADGNGQRKLTSGKYDDREPAWSHDGTRIAFSSDRDSSGNYDIWTLDVARGSLKRVTTTAANDFLPTWSPDDSEIAFTSTRDGNSSSIWVVTLATGAERRHSPAGVNASAPSWGPGGEIVYHALGTARSSLVLDTVTLTRDQNAFSFRASWATAASFYYTADGRIWRWDAATAMPTPIPFEARLPVAPASYTRRVRDVDSRAPRKALGIVSPTISPDGQRVAFAALGDIYTMAVGGLPRKLTNDRFLDTEPAWSPDGTRIVYSSDKGGGFLNLWVRDLATGRETQLTSLSTSAMGAAWSPDGSRIAFLDVDGLWRRASVSVVDVKTREVTKVLESSFGPGTPTWSADGKRIAVAVLVPFSSRFREGFNQILTIPVAPDAGEARTYVPIPDRSIDSRAGAGPAWSPDGTMMAIINEGTLAIIPVLPNGRPTRSLTRFDREMAHSPSWRADSRRVLYQAINGLRMVNIETGAIMNVPVDLSYTPNIPTGRIVVHAGRLVDGKSATAHTDMDVIVEGNRIRRVEPHAAALHTGEVVDASGLTVMPGLIEFHSHLQKDMGSAHGRAWLAFGITTVRSPGGTPYEAVEDREAVDAGVRPGPRVYTAGYLMEWERSYYKMSVAVANTRHLELELERSRALQHDLVKSYVRMPDLEQRRIIEFAHTVGIPAYSHEIYPSALSGIDGVEHTTGTSRRGYSPKASTLGRSYGDVAAIISAAKMTFTPTVTLGPTWLRYMLGTDESLRDDPRFALMVPWVRATVSTRAGATATGGSPTRPSAGPAGEMIMAASRAGARIVAGTDTPNPLNLHAELLGYVAAGMSPFEALRSATATSAAALGLEAGIIEPGKPADLVAVEGNPLDDIAHARRVRWTMANGRMHRVADLVSPR